MLTFFASPKGTKGNNKRPNSLVYSIQAAILFSLSYRSSKDSLLFKFLLICSDGTIVGVVDRNLAHVPYLFGLESILRRKG